MGKPGSNPWTTAEVRKLRQLVEEQHLSARTIDNMQLLPRHPFWSISREITNYCDLTDRKNSISIKLAMSRRLTGETRESFKKDVLNRIGTEPLAAIAASWNVSNKTVARVCDEAGIDARQREIPASSPLVASAVIAKQIGGRDAKYKQRRQERRTEFAIRSGWRLNREKGLKKKTCCQCKLKLAEDREFFCSRSYS